MPRKTGLFVLLVCIGMLAGCQSGPIASRQATLGTLKTSVSQLEFKNQELEKQVAELKSENRHYEERLTQEQTENDDLATRLDNVKSMLGQRDGAMDIRTGGRSRSDVDLDEPAPKARRSTVRRKPPAASIPGRIEPARDADDVGMNDDPPSRGRLASSTKARPREERWLPVAQGLGTRSDSQVK